MLLATQQTDGKNLYSVRILWLCTPKAMSFVRQRCWIGHNASVDIDKDATLRCLSHLIYKIFGLVSKQEKGLSDKFRFLKKRYLNRRLANCKVIWILNDDRSNDLHDDLPPRVSPCNRSVYKLALYIATWLQPFYHVNTHNIKSYYGHSFNRIVLPDLEFGIIDWSKPKSIIISRHRSQHGMNNSAMRPLVIVFCRLNNVPLDSGYVFRVHKQHFIDHLVTI